MEHCNKAGLKPPEFKIDDAFVITIWRKRGIAFENIGGQISGQIGGQISGQISETQQKILSLINGTQGTIKKNARINNT